ncbi:hypothetical protein GCM10018953_27950 [Streptosporangium nondiastaticum]|uniref:Uncharacterized protein n=1 Tax=Streptosporangium pseudovulgare TaxID=35765 RepID=A0ABQ2RM53_9ACTN|nr:hypothetical protein GCM10010140_73650 [Streptosporangium pseudovulgare]
MGEDDFGHLERLVSELDSRGLHARLVRTRSGRPFVRVINPNATSLAENVTCRAQPATAPRPPDVYYWWSWGERMHTVEDPAGAATKVARVLAAVGE